MTSLVQRVPGGGDVVRLEREREMNQEFDLGLWERVVSGRVLGFFVNLARNQIERFPNQEKARNLFQFGEIEPKETKQSFWGQSAGTKSPKR